MRLPDLKFTPLPDGDILVESQYLSEGDDPLYSTRERGRIADMGTHRLFVTVQHSCGVNALGLPEMEQIVAKMKEPRA